MCVYRGVCTRVCRGGVCVWVMCACVWGDVCVHVCRGGVCVSIYIYHNFFTHSSINGHLGYFRV